MFHGPRQWTEPEPVGRLLRLAIDVVNECNLRCRYCHPGQVWHEAQIPATKVRELLADAEGHGILEVVLTGGEITLHHDLPAVFDATHELHRSAVSLITNATRVTREVQEMARASNLTRLCVSIDGVDNQLHGSARGRNLPKVLEGLRLLAECGKPITVVTVVHRANWRRVIELSEFLADERLAAQHHLCAPCYSGEAKKHYPNLALTYDEFSEIQAIIDSHHADLLARGLYVTFNSYWPATGQPTSIVNPGRTISLQQLVEQVKDTLCNVRPNGEFRIQANTWGREMMGNATHGSIYDQTLTELLTDAETALASGKITQLPRHVEALHKYQIGHGADAAQTNVLLADRDLAMASVPLVPLRSIDSHWLLDNPFIDREALLSAMTQDPTAYRVVEHPTGTILVFNRVRSQVTLIRPNEWKTLHAATN